MLTERLAAIANEIEKGESVADIGTDHGYLPMYLTKEEISPKVIMADISKGSLNKARRNCRELIPEVKFDFRNGNGLRVIKKGEVDVIVIAGMGGNLICDILGRDLGKAKSCKKLILQPRTAQGRLRAWLVRKGFDIVNEQLVREGRFICEIITAVPGEPRESIKLNLEPESIKWEMPYWVANLKNPLVNEFISYKIDRENRILKSMENSKNIPAEDVKAIEDNIVYLESLL